MPERKQVFISYRHTEPDQDLAKTLDEFLRERGCPVFRDDRIEIGTRWIDRIDRELRASGFFVVLISSHSIRSDMVRQEVQTAHQLEREGKMRILPVRVGFDGELPYDLASYLNPIQYAKWRPGDPFEEVCAQLYGAIEGSAALPWRTAEDGDPSVLVVRTPGDVPEADGAPWPAADPRIVMETGTVRLDSPFYVRRRADETMAAALGSRGVTLVVKGTRQSGKSSLLARAHALARHQGRAAVYLDFQTLDEDHLATLKSLLRCLAHRIARGLRTEMSPQEVWDDDLGAKESFAEFLATAVLAPATEPVLLALDEVDRIFDRSYRTDFFAAVRSWHNNRALSDAWDKLHLALAHATDPALWIEDLNQSPFNVGERLRLDAFTVAEVADLNRRHGTPLADDGEVAALHELVGGQPYLVRQALYVLAKNEWSLADLERADGDDGPFDDHLRRHLWTLHKNERLIAAVRRILRTGECEDERDYQRLLAAGLIAGDDRRSVRMRCKLYHDYFRKHL